MRAGRDEAPARELFRDAAFPASDSSLFFNSSTPLAQFREAITWRRPQEICAAPRLLPGSPWEGRVRQGLLGDCWFLCACAALQKKPHLLDQGDCASPGARERTCSGSPCWKRPMPSGARPGGPDWRPGGEVEPEGRSGARWPAGRRPWRRGAEDLSAAAPPEGRVSDQLLGAQPRSRCQGPGGVPRLHRRGSAGAPESDWPEHPASADSEPLGPAPLAGALEGGVSAQAPALACAAAPPAGRAVLPVPSPRLQQLSSGPCLRHPQDGRRAEQGLGGVCCWRPLPALRRSRARVPSRPGSCSSDPMPAEPGPLSRGAEPLCRTRPPVKTVQRRAAPRPGPSARGLLRPGSCRGEGWSHVEPAEEAGLLSQLQDGEFWVEEEEFLREFEEVTVGYPVTAAGHLQSLYTGKALSHLQALPGAWVVGQSAGGCRNNSCFPCNPKFWLRLSEPSEVCVAVLQKPGKRVTSQARAPQGRGRAPASLLGQDYQAVGLHVWKVERRRVSLPRVLSAPPVAGTVCHAYEREVHLHCELPAGFHLVVPSTFLKDMAGQFLLRVFSSGPVSLSAVRPEAKGAAPGAASPAGEWETVRLRGSWKAGRTAGGCRNFPSYLCNPCLPFSVPEGGPRRTRISLQQHCGPDAQLHAIGFHLFQVPAAGEGQAARPLLLREPLLSCVPHRHAQEVSQLCLLSPGAYRVVPSTYLPDAEGAFTVTIATRVDRRSIHSQEMLGQVLQEVSFMAVMKT